VMDGFNDLTRPVANADEGAKTMSYTKPEVATLGEAARVIQQFIKGNVLIEPATGKRRQNPAYDLDD